MKDWTEITAWRKARRAELIAAREALATDKRRAWDERITASLKAGIPVAPGAVVGFCWPYKSEFDARFAVRYWRDGGAIAALPEVVDKKGPLRFSKWWPGAPMRSGVYGIPVPDGTGELEPDFAVVPMNGFDARGYRLGYGGGYFDRTLAALDRRAIAIGVTYEALRLQTIHPQPHDIPMDFVVTEAGIYRAGGQPIATIEPAACAAEVAALLKSRGLPRSRVASPAAAAPVAAGGYASPACAAAEIAPDYFGEPAVMPEAELVELLNVLLEAERAGAKALAELMNDYERDTPAWRQLSAVQRDEAKNCAILMDLVRQAKGVPSSETGDFIAKLLAVQGKVPRLKFLNRGQSWVARKIDEALPRLGGSFALAPLAAMLESHLLNIEACEALIETLEG